MANVIATVKSDSSDRVYEIRQSDKDDVIYCTCPAWKFSVKRLGHHDCKHLQRMASRLAYLTANNTRNS